jgi:hypothetical protein
MKELITYYIVYIIFLLALFSTVAGGIMSLLSGSIGGVFMMVLVSLPFLMWQFWLSYVLKGCAGKQNWLLPE